MADVATPRGRRSPSSRTSSKARRSTTQIGIEAEETRTNPQEEAEELALISQAREAIVASLMASAVGLFGIGAGITLLTGRSLLFSGGRQVAVGLAAAALTFGVGRLIGVSLT